MLWCLKQHFNDSATSLAAKVTYIYDMTDNFCEEFALRVVKNAKKDKFRALIP